LKYSLAVELQLKSAKHIFYAFYLIALLQTKKTENNNKLAKHRLVKKPLL